MATIRDTDLLYVQRGETPHRWTGAELKSLVSNAAKAGTLTVGQYLTPLSGKYNGTSDLTINVDGTASATPGKVVVRDSNGSFAGNVITANSFVGDGSQLTNAGAVLSDHTGIQRLVTTTLTEGVMVTAATSSALTFNQTQLELSINNKVKLRGQSGKGIFDGGVETSGSFESNRSGSLVPGLSIKNEGVEKLVIYNSGRIDTKSTINISTTNSSAINIFPSETSGTASIILQNNGNAFFTGNVDIGSGNIQLNSNGSATFSGTVTGNLIVGLKTLTSGDYIRGSNYNGQTARTWHVDATSANTASKVVARDSNGNFSAGTITASLNGNASSASNADKLDNINSTQFLRSDANDSFSGALTGSGTIYTTGTLMGIKGDGGGVALTTNDGQGNANVTFNHVSGVPDQSGSSARIESSVDSTVADMIFELQDNVTANTAVTLTETLKLTTSTITYKGNTIYHGGNMGSNSGLDADKLDGLHASSFLRSDANDTATGQLTLNGRVNIRGNLDISDNQNVDFGSSDDVRITYNPNNWLYVDFKTTGNGLVFRDSSADVMVLEDSGIFRPSANNTGSIGTNTLRWGNIYATTFTGALSGNASSATNATNSRVDHRTNNSWHRPIFVIDSQSSAANLRLYSDSASTIGINPSTNEVRATRFIGALTGKATDADKLDGLDSTQFLRSDANDTTTGSLTVNGVVITNEIRNRTGSQLVLNAGESAGKVAEQTGELVYVNAESGLEVCTPDRSHSNWEGGYTVDKTTIRGEAILIKGNTVWHAGNDGSGSGLDADKVDGLQASSFLRSDANDTATGTLTMNGAVNIRSVIDISDNKILRFGSSDDITIKYDPNNWLYTNFVTSNGIIFQDNGSNKMRLEDSGIFRPEATNTGSIGTSSVKWANVYATTFHGALSGNASSATNASYARIDHDTGNAWHRPVFVDDSTDASGANRRLKTDNETAIGINPSTNRIKAARFDGELSGNASSSTNARIDHDTGDAWHRPVFIDDEKTSATNQRLKTDNAATIAINPSTNQIRATTFVGALSGKASDADKLDGINSTSFLRSDAGDTYNGGSTSHVLRFQVKSGLTANVSSGSLAPLEVYQATKDKDAFIAFHVAGDYAAYFGLDGATNDLFWGGWSRGATKYRVWHAGNDGSGSGLDADKLDGIQASSFLRSDSADSFSKDISSSGSARLLMKKTDNDVSDHIIFYNTSTRMGEIGCQDTTWLRINQVTDKNIYTPRYIRADNGFYVDGTSKGINGSGNFIGGTIAGASDYGTLLRSNADDTATGTLTFNGRVNIRGHIDLSDGENLDFGSSDDVRINYNSNNWMYFNFRSGDGIIFQDNGSNKMRLEDSGIFRPESNNIGSIGTSSVKWANIYATTFHGALSGKATDADKLDGINSSSFLRSDANDSSNSILTFTQSNYVANRWNTVDKVPTSGASIAGGADNGTNPAIPANLVLASWYGVSINPTISNQAVTKGHSAWLCDARSGDTRQKGNVYAAKDVIAYYSDSRLKDKIGDIDHALNKVCDIDTLIYKHNDIARENGFTDDKEHIGVIAQSVKEVCPQAVERAPFDMKTDPKTGETSSLTGEDYLTVKYEKLVPLLIESIKELKAEIEDLKSK